MRTKSKYLIVLATLFAFVLVSCGEQEAPPKDKNMEKMKKEALMNKEEARTVETEKTQITEEGKAKVHSEAAVPSVTGTWTGKFDSRDAVLTITEQKDANISGTILIKYREPVTQQVAGSVNAETNMVSMEDKLHSRYMGKYSGKLNDDGSTLSGTFTMNNDGKKVAFSFSKPVAKAAAAVKDAAKTIDKSNLKKKVGGN